MGTLVGWSNFQSWWHLFCQPCCSVSVVGVASAAVSIGITWCWRADLVGLAGSHTLSSASTAGPSICGMLWKCAWLCTDQVDYTLHQGLSSSPQTQSSEFCIHPSWWGLGGRSSFDWVAFNLQPSHISHLVTESPSAFIFINVRLALIRQGHGLRTPNPRIVTKATCPKQQI